MIPPQPPNQSSDLKLEGLTRDQIKKIEKSMKKPQFMGLLNQYMIEISDPKNKAEYDEYLKQMQKEGQLPKHMKLIKLKPQFCFRTQIVSNRNKKHEMKFFINMCSSDYIQKPSCEPGKDENGGVGYSWKVPNSLGKIRYDQDKHKNPCQVIDCAFHPDTFIFSNSNSAFQAMIISIALQGAEKQLGQRKQSLSRDYIVLKNVKCKGENGQPALLPIRYISGKAYNKGQGPVEQERNTEGKETKLQKQINKQKEEFEAQKSKNIGQQKSNKHEEQKQEDLDENKKNLVQDLEKGIVTPKYSSIYTYITDYSQFIDGPAVKKARSLPSTFTVQFKVPRMENIGQANTLEINEKKIILSVEGKYYIDLYFQDMKVKNYPLKTGEAKAKFDKKKKTLRLQIPVDISSIPEQDLPQYKIINESRSAEQEKQEKIQIIENQTWKNKVLQIDDQSSTEKFLNSEKVQEQKGKKKLIEQIDEDDVIQQKEEKAQQQIVQSKQEHNFSNQYQAKRFSLSEYYEKLPQQKFQNSVQAQELSHIFKQSPKHLFIVFYMRNYYSDQVNVSLSEKRCEFLLVWLHQRANVAHLELSQNYLGCVEKAEYFKRVGFVSFVIHKKKQNYGIWGEQSIKCKTKNEGPKEVGYYTSMIQRMKSEAAVQQENKKKAVELENRKKEKANEIKTQQLKKEQKKMQQIDNQIKDRSEDNEQSKSMKIDLQKNKVQSAQVFKKLPIQFLKFNLDFIEALS